MYIPQCNRTDGGYLEKQCDPTTGECWCVDLRGFEVSKTRVIATNSLSLDCDNTKQQHTCPLFNCVGDCDHGFELDDGGCRTCKCVDPCAKVTCRGEGEVCRLVDVECVSWPCPPVAVCLPKKENPCQNGEPLKLGRSEETVSCGPDHGSCPSSHKCQLSPLGEYAVCCPKPRK